MSLSPERSALQQRFVEARASNYTRASNYKQAISGRVDARLLYAVDIGHPSQPSVAEMAGSKSEKGVVNVTVGLIHPDRMV